MAPAAIVVAGATVLTPQQALAQAPVLSLCSGVGVSLPVLNPIVNTSGGLLSGLLSPVNTALGNLTGDINANLVNALSGQPLSVTALDQNGNLISLPSSGCSVSVTSPNGITLGGGQINGLGGNGNPTASAGDPSAIAIGNGAVTSAGVVNSVAFGTGASATTAGAVALGSGSVASRLNSSAELFSGSALRTTLGVASVGSAGNERQITNVAGGTADTDAANIRQLRTVGGSLATSLGGGGGFNPVTGVFSPPSYSVGGTPYASVGGAIGALDAVGTTNTTNINNILNGTVGLVQQDPTTRAISIGATTNGGVINIAGTAGARQITGLAAGAGTLDAVNVGQLNSAIAGVGTGSPTVASENSGGAAPPTATGLRSVAVGYGSSAAGADTFSVGAPGAERRLVNVAAGIVAANSTDGVNGGQLFATRQGVIGNTAAIGGGASFDPATGAYTAPSFVIRSATYGDVGGALGAVDAALGANQTNITNLTNNIDNGTIGLVRQDPATRVITVGAGANGGTVNVAGTAGTRQITGVAAGAGSTDAVNVAQLNGAIISVSAGSLALSSENSGLQAPALATGLRSVAVGFGSVATAPDTFSVGRVGAERRLVNVAPGTIATNSTDGVNGSQLFATRQGVIGNTAAIGGGSTYDPVTGAYTAPSFSIRGTTYGDVGGALGAVDTALGSNQTNITNLTNNINNGTIGLVRQDLATRVISVGAGTNGGTVNVAGTAGTRQITGVAAGAGSTDAVNVAQLNGALISVTAGSLALSSENSQLQAPALATGLRSVAVGYGSVATDADTFSVGRSGAERRIVNVAPGTLSATSTDAVNGSQLFATNNLITSNSTGLNQIYDRLITSLGGGSSYNAGTGVFTFPSYSIRGTSYSSVGTAFAAVDGALAALENGGNTGGGGRAPFVGNSPDGTTPPVASGANSVAGGYQAMAAGAAGASIGDSAKAMGDYSTSFGGESMAGGVGSAAIGARATAADYETTAVGGMSTAMFQGSVALGAHAQAMADPATAIGYYSTATGDDSVSVGGYSTATGVNSTAIGSMSVASGANSTAIGHSAAAAGAGSVAIGQNASAAPDNSVAVGVNVTATRPNQVVVGNAQNTYSLPGVASAASNAAQTGSTHFVTTDTAGNLGTTNYGPESVGALNDSVNQLARLGIQARREARSGIASAMAMAAAPMPSMAGKTSWAANGAAFRGEWASGFAVAHRLDTAVPIAVTAGYSYGEAAGHGVRFGLAGEF